MELATSLKAGRCSPHLACIQKKGALLDSGALNGLEELQQFGLGGSLYGLQSLKSRWRLSRYLREGKLW